jgi:hypothetical protein
LHFGEIEAFVKISIPFEDIFREIEAFIKKLRLFLKLRGFFQDYELFEDIFNGTEAIV